MTTIVRDRLHPPASRPHAPGPAADRFTGPDVASAAIVVLMLTASMFGLFFHGLYRDTTWAKSAFRGNDLATLVFAVPVFVAALVLARRGWSGARLVWLGMLAYNVYNYAFYLFGAAFNELFLLYAALVTLSSTALIASAPRVTALRLPGDHVPRRSVGAYLVLVGVITGALWVVQSLKFITSGTLPQVLTDTASPTSIIYALDLTMLVPACLAAGVLLWRRHPFGLTAAVGMNVMATVYMLALWFGAGFQADAGIHDKSWVQPLNYVLAAASLTATVALLRSSSPRDREPR